MSTFDKANTLTTKNASIKSRGRNLGYRKEHPNRVSLLQTLAVLRKLNSPSSQTRLFFTNASISTSAISVPTSDKSDKADPQQQQQQQHRDVGNASNKSSSSAAEINPSKLLALPQEIFSTTILLVGPSKHSIRKLPLGDGDEDRDVTDNSTDQGLQKASKEDDKSKLVWQVGCTEVVVNGDILNDDPKSFLLLREESVKN
ncbi:hypothetical protein HDU76_006902 [Blyttiomyces sp. JEL0837]|nr:hypothetical protein HDU76_006902 [Blyttiomyces sp. JEL0837]